MHHELIDDERFIIGCFSLYYYYYEASFYFILIITAGYIPYLRCQRPDASVIEINLETTSNSSICDVSFTGKAGELLPELFDVVQDMIE